MSTHAPTPAGDQKLRVCAVSYLNTVPLVWGMTYGPQRGIFDLEFAIPSVCADRLESRHADIGLVPCAELDRLQLAFLPETGIACRGRVRSILLISKCRPEEIRTLAADVSSRSSVMLGRIVVSERYGATPEILSAPPQLETMLERADAALIIGDPALRIDPAALPFSVLDLGEEWLALTGLPMVFAVWAGRPEVLSPELGEVFTASCRYGLSCLEDIVADSARTYGFSPEFVRRYLTEHLTMELGSEELRGLELFRSKVAALRSLDRATSGILVP